MRETNEQREDRVFREFLRVSGLGGERSKIEPKDPPHPDILFSTNEDEQIAFELVELIDRAYAHRLALMLGTIQDMPRYFERQDTPTQEAVRERFSDAMVFVQFFEQVGMTQRRQLLPLIFVLLAESEFEGVGDMELNEELLNHLERITIYRGDISGPRFDCASAGYLGDPTIPAIKSKFRKRYEAEAPLHLLAYVEGHPMLPDEIWLEGTKEFLLEYAPGAQFETIWIFDNREGEVKYSWSRRDVA